MKLKNKNVLITGGGRGLGFEITKGYLKEGANIIFVEDLLIIWRKLIQNC